MTGGRAAGSVEAVFREERGRLLAMLVSHFGDLDLALVAEIIGTADVEPGMRDAAFRQKHQHFDTTVSVDDQRAMNATSISIAAGIPRETVRRKIRQLLKLGFIVEKEPARYVLKPGSDATARACPVDHGTGSRSQILIEAISMVPRNM